MLLVKEKVNFSATINNKTLAHFYLLPLLNVFVRRSVSYEEADMTF